MERTRLRKRRIKIYPISSLWKGYIRNLQIIKDICEQDSVPSEAENSSEKSVNGVTQANALLQEKHKKKVRQLKKKCKQHLVQGGRNLYK